MAIASRHLTALTPSGSLLLAMTLRSIPRDKRPNPLIYQEVASDSDEVG